jgi:hypothetical protein
MLSKALHLQVRRVENNRSIKQPKRKRKLSLKLQEKKTPNLPRGTKLRLTILILLHKIQASLLSMRGSSEVLMLFRRALLQVLM